MATALALVLCLAPVAGAHAQQQPGGAPIIRDVQVVGNQRVEAETVRSYMNVGFGDVYDPEKVDQALKNLFSTGLFADVSIRREGSTLVVRVVENPIINRMVFEGNKKIKDEDFLKEVQLRPRIVFTRARVQADVQRMLELYRRKGRFGATVEPKVIQLPQNRVDLVFEINEGEKTGIQYISFLGNEAYSDGELRSQITTKQSRWWRFFSSNDNYDPDRMAYDREQLRKFYLNNGYADFRVISAVAEMTPDREDFYMAFTVEEGPVYTFGTMDVESQIRDLDPNILKYLIATRTGSTYNAQTIEDTVDILTDAAGLRGYAFVNIRPRIQRDAENRKINITYVIQEAPRVYVERVRINGNVRTLDKVIRREMRLTEGDAFNTAKLRRSRTRIRGLGYFKEAEVEQTEGSAPDRAIIDVTVEEQPTGELQIGAGFSSRENFIGELTVRERNLLGRGQDLRLSTSISSLRTTANIGFTEPYFLDRPLAAGFDLFLTDTDFQDYASYDQKTMGTTLRAGFPLTETKRMQLRYTVRQDKIYHVSTNNRYIQEAAGDFTTSSIGYTFVWDERNDYIKPTNGFRFLFNQDLAGLLGNVRYLKTQLSYDVYTTIPFARAFILKLSTTEGYINGLGKDVRINDRFFIGGTDLRGFRTAGIGPRVAYFDPVTGEPLVDSKGRAAGEALGGNLFYTGSLELFIPLGMAEQYGIQLSTFADIGSLTGLNTGITDVDYYDSGAPRASVGIGVSWDSPMGPLRFDLSKPILKEPYDITETFQFNIGTRF
jgi:outer membrane protein insertion porin family